MFAPMVHVNEKTRKKPWKMRGGGFKIKKKMSQSMAQIILLHPIYEEKNITSGEKFVCTFHVKMRSVGVCGCASSHYVRDQ